jgi:Leucine-rich repeat (LRR) protein
MDEVKRRVDECIRTGSTELHLCNLYLTSLPDLPDTLTDLYCYNNQLTVLPELPDTLTQLICFYNQLTVLPELPDTLTHLYCYNNQLTVLPESLPFISLLCVPIATLIPSADNDTE